MPEKRALGTVIQPIGSVGGKGGGFQPTISTPGTATPGSIPSGGASVFNQNLVTSTAPRGTAIDPTDSLRGREFLPPGQTQNALDRRAQQALGGARVSSEFSPLAGESRDLLIQRLRDLSGPDRTQLAQEAFNIFREGRQPQFDMDLRNVGKRASALGRVGAGMTTNDLTGVFGQQERGFDLLSRSLINDAAGQTLQDRLNIAGATGQGSGILEGQDLSRQGLNANLALQRSGMLGQFGQQQFGRGVTQRGEQRQERSFQDFLAQQALQNRVGQQQAERDEAQRAFERDFAEQQLRAQLAMSQPAGFPATGGAGPSASSFDVGAAGGFSGGCGPSIVPPQQPAPSIFPQPGTSPSGLGLSRPFIGGGDEIPRGIFGTRRF